MLGPGTTSPTAILFARSPPVRCAEGTPESDEYSLGVRHLLYRRAEARWASHPLPPLRHEACRDVCGLTSLLKVSSPSYYQLILQWYRPLQLNGRVTHTLFTDRSIGLDRYRYIGTTFFESSLAGCVNPDFLVNSVEFWSEPINRINWMLRSPPAHRASPLR